MEKDWVKVYSSHQLQNVELLRHLLARNDIKAIILNQQDSIYVTIGDIYLLVKGEHVIRAKKIISDSGL